ncbi:hypothetical protein CHUAL_007031 [Chamberlinius hualienensis]
MSKLFVILLAVTIVMQVHGNNAKNIKNGNEELYAPETIAKRAFEIAKRVFDDETVQANLQPLLDEFNKQLQQFFDNNEGLIQFAKNYICN